LLDKGALPISIGYHYTHITSDYEIPHCPELSSISISELSEKVCSAAGKLYEVYVQGSFDFN